MSEPKKGGDSLEELKKRLYTRGEIKRRPLRMGRLLSHEETVSGNWGNEAPVIIKDQEEKPPTSPFRKFFIAAIVFFIAAIGYAGYEFLGGANIVSSKNIDVNIAGPSFVGGGDEISLQVTVANGNSVPLEFANLFVEHQKGATSANASSTPDMVRSEIPLPKIPAGGSEVRVVKVVLYGEEGSSQSINFNLEYRVQGSNAIFQKDTVYPVKISSSPLNLSVDGPKEVNAGQDISFNIKVSSNAPKDVPNVLLKIDYPPGFLFSDANPKPTYGNGVWNLGDFHTGSSRTVRITGRMSGQNGDERNFSIMSGSPSLDDQKTLGVIYNSIFQKVSINRPFLDATISLNGDTSDTPSLSGGKEVRGYVMWKNNLPTRITDARISLSFSGNAFDRNFVSSDSGFYNSSANSIEWDRNSISDFETIEPGASGQLPFLFRPLPSVSSGGVMNNPSIELSLNVKGDVSGSDSSGINSVTTKKQVKILSEMQLLSRAVYYSGPFTNSGPIPPTAEKPTMYTVLWDISNSSNDLGGVSVSTVLPPYVSWTNRVSPADENISYAESTRTVTWQAGNVSAGTGYGGKASKSVSFQIKLVPSISHIGSSVALTGGVSISGTDRFAGAVISFSKDAITTMLNSDPGFKSGNDIVQSAK